MPLPNSKDDDLIDLTPIFRRIGRGLSLTIGLTLVGVVAGVGGGFALAMRHQANSQLGISISGLSEDSGLHYPDTSPFHTEDLRSLDILRVAAQRAGLQDPEAAASTLYRHLTVFRPPSPSRTADTVELHLLLTSAADLPLSDLQSQAVLTDIAQAYAEKFAVISSRLPPSMGQVFKLLPSVDYSQSSRLIAADVASLKQGLIAKGSILSPQELKLLEDLNTLTDVNLPAFDQQVETTGATKWPDRGLRLLVIKQRQIAQREKDLLLEKRVIEEMLAQPLPFGPPPAQTAASSSQTLVFGPANQELVSRVFTNTLALRKLEVEKEETRERERQLRDPSSDRTNGNAAVVAALAKVEADYHAIFEQYASISAEKSRPSRENAVRITQPAVTAAHATPERGTLLGGVLGLLLGLGLSLLRPDRAKGAGREP